MKLAVCYRGHLRTIDQTIGNHRSALFKDHEVDIFCHTWSGAYDDKIDFLRKQPESKIVLEETPKCMEIHPYEDLLFSGRINVVEDKNKTISNNQFKVLPYNCLSLLYSTFQSNLVRKIYEQSSGVKYDLVCIMRPDLFFYDQVDVNSLRNDAINISWYENIGDKLDHAEAIIDHIAIGNSSIIDYYADSFLYIPTYYFRDRTLLIPEILLGHHIAKCPVNMLNIRHKVIRIQSYDHLRNIDK